MSRELLSPVAKRRFADVESHALFAHRSDDEVDVWIALVGMQRHRVTMLKRESVQGERPYRRRKLVRRGAFRHRENKIVNKLGRLSAVGDGSIGMATQHIQVEIPLEHQILLESSFHQPLVYIGFDFIQTLSPDIVKMGPDAVERPSAAGH